MKRILTYIFDPDLRQRLEKYRAENQELRDAPAFPPVAEKTIDNLTETVVTLRAELAKKDEMIFKQVQINDALRAKLAREIAMLDEVEEWNTRIHRVDDDPIAILRHLVGQFGNLEDILAKRKDGE